MVISTEATPTPTSDTGDPGDPVTFLRGAHRPHTVRKEDILDITDYA